MKIGNLDITKCYLGVNDINKIYLGTSIIFENNPPQNEFYHIENGRLIWAHPDIYLISSGTQYIDTLYEPTVDDIIETNFYKIQASTHQSVFSAGTGTSQLIALCAQDNDSKIFCRYFTTGAAVELTSIGSYCWNYIKYYNTTIIVNNQEQQISNKIELDTDKTLYLFLRRNKTSPLIGGIKHFIIKNNDVEKRHFVPVPTGLIIGNFTVPSNGMFDIITQTFYGNAGTGEFHIHFPGDQEYIYENPANSQLGKIPLDTNGVSKTLIDASLTDI